MSGGMASNIFIQKQIEIHTKTHKMLRDHILRQISNIIFYNLYFIVILLEIIKI